MSAQPWMKRNMNTQAMSMQRFHVISSNPSVAIRKIFCTTRNPAPAAANFHPVILRRSVRTHTMQESHWASAVIIRGMSGSVVIKAVVSEIMSVPPSTLSVPA